MASLSSSHVLFNNPQMKPLILLISNGSSNDHMCCVLRSPISQTYIYLKSLLVNTHDMPAQLLYSFHTSQYESDLIHIPQKTFRQTHVLLAPLACSKTYIYLLTKRWSRRRMICLTDFLLPFQPLKTGTIYFLFHISQNPFAKDHGLLGSLASPKTHVSQNASMVTRGLPVLLGTPSTPF
jgi:hypothetical protein